MKNLSRVIIAVILAVLMAGLVPAQVFADTPDYISEIKVYEGNCKKANEEGYTVLSDGNGKPIDLNQNAGGGTMSKGEKAVYLGYKTTNDKDDAITDLALMNMKGGYSIEDYELLMEKQMKSQIIPFVEDFMVAIEEYRANYNSKIKKNKEKAVFIHNVLNKLTDDDCGGAGLGELLLNKTVYEMAMPEYEKLSDEEKKEKSFYDYNNEVRDSLPEKEKNEHADILTIIAQSNGQAMILLCNLITRACDAENDTWIERFAETDYNDLVDVTGKTPTDAAKELARKYDDDAQRILENWDALREALADYEKTGERLLDYEGVEEDEISDKSDNLSENGLNSETAEDFVDLLDAGTSVMDFNSDLEDVIIYEYLAGFEYGDSNLLEFFLQEKEDVEDDITALYPLVASLSEGQRAGLEYVSLKNLISAAATDSTKYDEENIESLEPASIYDGVDRTIYEKGGVALTSDSLRNDALARTAEENASSISPLTKIFWGLSAASAIGIAVSVITHFRINNSYAPINALNEMSASVANTANMNRLVELGKQNVMVREGLYTIQSKGFVPDGIKITEIGVDFENGFAIESYTKYSETISKEMSEIAAPQQANVLASNTGKYLAIGFSVAMVILTAVSIYFTFKDMAAKYKVELTPIPHYMVDEKDLIGYDSKGNQIVLKNQKAYYKAVECNRSEKAEFYDSLGTCADMNGDVGAQWLALYSVKNDAEAPIIASSLKAVVKSTDIPAGYKTGIHMFGSDTAFNLNTYPYDWNKQATKVFVYFKRDDTAKTTGSVFSAGTLALTGGAGILVGVLGTLAATSKKRKENETVSA